MKTFHVLLFALALPLAGCAVRAGAAVPVPEAAIDVDYEPLYYGPNIVYYDDDGLPYFVDGGIVYYVPRNEPRFNVYVSHYHSHRDRYISWERSHRHNVEVDVRHYRDRRPPARVRYERRDDERYYDPPSRRVRVSPHQRVERARERVHRRLQPRVRRDDDRNWRDDPRRADRDRRDRRRHDRDH